MHNVNVTSSHADIFIHRLPFYLTSQLISLNPFVLNILLHRRIITIIILYISLVLGNNVNCGQVNSIIYNRRMVVICLFSYLGVNIAIILFGAGSFNRFFDRDISFRCNRVKLKYVVSIINPFN